MIYAFFWTVFLLLLAFAAKRRPRLRPYLIAANTAAVLFYLAWRTTVIPWGRGVEAGLGILLFLCECMGLLQFIILQLLSLRPYRPRQRFLTEYGANPPDVDVLICTYNEPPALLEKTILAALGLDYPEGKLHVYVCDDGRREELRALCRELGAGYLTRPDNEGAKAGNLNHALQATESELFAVLDADMVCTRKFLERTVGYFLDPSTAFVQTPQVYYNQDMYQRNLRRKLPNEQDFFMRGVQEARASVNAVLHVGTNAVFRRPQVAEVGYYPTFSITEDMALGLLLQMKGYRGVFINEALVLGLSASSYTDLALQRDRWCRGNLQVMRKLRPLTRRGLTLWQKTATFDSLLYWLMCFQKLVYLLLPLWFFWTGQRSVTASLAELLQHMLPVLVGQVSVFSVIAGGTRTLRWAHYYEIAMAPHTCISILKQLFGIRTPFMVTDKREKNRSHFQFRAAAPHLLFVLLTLLAWGFGIRGLLLGTLSPVAFLVNFAWSLYHFWGLMISVRVAYHARKKEDDRFAVIQEGFGLRGFSAGGEAVFNLLALSEEGMLLRALQDPPPEEGMFLSVELSLGARSCQVPGTVQAVEGRGFFLRYAPLDPLVKQAIINLYVDYLRPAFDVGKSQEYD